MTQGWQKGNMDQLGIDTPRAVWHQEVVFQLQFESTAFELRVIRELEGLVAIRGYYVNVRGAQRTILNTYRGYGAEEVPV